MPGTHGGRNRRAHQLRALGVLAHGHMLMGTLCALGLVFTLSMPLDDDVSEEDKNK